MPAFDVHGRRNCIERAMKAQHASESLKDAFKDSLEGLCDCVLHLDGSFNFVQPCPRLASILVSPGRFSCGDSLASAFSESRCYLAFEQKCSKIGSDVSVVEMKDAFGARIGMQFHHVTFEDSHDQLHVIIGGTEFGERQHLAFPNVANLDPQELERFQIKGATSLGWRQEYARAAKGR